MHINDLLLFVQKSVTKILQIHHDKYHNLWLMQIVKSDTYRVLNVAAKLCLSICAHVLIIIYYEYSYTPFLYSNTNFDCCFFCVLSSF